jgi:hypothetical protein
MTWTKLSDDFSDDCWELSDAAVRLHMEGLVWSNRKLLDLHLRKDDMVRWAKRPGAAEELVNAGWWRDKGNHYVIVHHGMYQRTRKAVLRQQEANKANITKRWSGRERHNESSYEPYSEPNYETEYKRDGTGRVQDRPGKGTNNASVGDEKNDEYGAVIDDAYEREMAACFDAGATYEPPAYDADGNPLDDWEPR